MSDGIEWRPMIAKSDIIDVSASFQQHLSAQIHQSLSCLTQIYVAIHLFDITENLNLFTDVLL